MSSKVFRDRHIKSAILPESERNHKQKRDREKHLKGVARNKQFMKEEIKRRGSCCQVCGLVDDPELYEWHHINYDEKLDDISTIVGAHASIKRIQAELDKCILVCPNCHKKIHLDLTCMVDHKYRPDLIPYSHVDSESCMKVEEEPKPTPIQLLFD